MMRACYVVKVAESLRSNTIMQTADKALRSPCQKDNSQFLPPPQKNKKKNTTKLFRNMEVKFEESTIALEVVLYEVQKMIQRGEAV